MRMSWKTKCPKTAAIWLVYVVQLSDYVVVIIRLPPHQQHGNEMIESHFDISNNTFAIWRELYQRHHVHFYEQ